MFVRLKLLEIRPTIASLRAELPDRSLWLAIVNASNRHAATGPSQRKDSDAASRALAVGYSPRLMLGEGWRNCQEPSWFSSWLISFSFIHFFFQSNF